MAEVIWTIELPYTFRVAAEDMNKDPTLIGLMNTVSYRIEIPRPAAADSILQVGRMTIWNCMHLRVVIECSDDEIEEMLGSQKLDGLGAEMKDDALSLLNAFLRAIRYETRQLQIQLLTIDDLANHATVRLCKENGDEMRCILNAFGDWGALRIGPDMDELPINSREIQRSMLLDSPADISLPLLYDAYGWLETHDVRRAVLDAAIAAELLVKRHLQEKGGNIYKLLVEEHSLGFSIVHLYDKVLMCLDQRSLKRDNSAIYDTIDYLFRTRNQLVHNGKCRHKNKKGKWQNVGIKEATRFLEAVTWTFNWLSDMKIAERPGIIRLQ